MSQEAIRAHSVVEANLYLLVTPCSICKHGARTPGSFLPTADGLIRTVTTCDNCGGADEHFFSVSRPVRLVDPLSDPLPINATQETSGIIDVVQWFTLYRLMLQSSNETPDKQEERWRKFRAGQCLDEALKFYRPDCLAPPETAFLSEQSRKTLRDDPERFSRERLIELRNRLPTIGVEKMVAWQREQRRHRKRWWPFW